MSKVKNLTQNNEIKVGIETKNYSHTSTLETKKEIKEKIKAIEKELNELDRKNHQT